MELTMNPVKQLSTIVNFRQILLKTNQIHLTLIMVAAEEQIIE